MRKRIKINGQAWTYDILDPETYVSNHGEGSVAITDIERLRIDFRGPEATLNTIIHELVHAFKSYLCLDNVNDIKDTDYEEIYATFFAKNGLTLLAVAIKIYVNISQDTNDSFIQAIKNIQKVEKLCKL